MDESRRKQARSYFRAITGITLVCCIGLLYVKREADIDETASRIKALETELGSLQVKTAEAGIRLEELVAYEKIVRLAAKQGLRPPTEKPMMVNLRIGEIPQSMKRIYVPLETDNIVNE